MRGGASLLTTSSPPHRNVCGAANAAAFTLVSMCEVTAAPPSASLSGVQMQHRRPNLPPLLPLHR